MQILSWFLVEALAAAALLALVVWWTWPRQPKKEKKDQGIDTQEIDTQE